MMDENFKLIIITPEITIPGEAGGQITYLVQSPMLNISENPFIVYQKHESLLSLSFLFIIQKLLFTAIMRFYMILA